MKPYLTCLCFCILFNSYAQEDIVYIPHSNLKEWLITKDYINTNGDNEIQVSEAIAYTGNVGGYAGSLGNPITDATGLEAFVNITAINFGGQALTTLDLSSNPLVELASLSYNDITSINLDNNLVLESVSLEFNNLTEVDVSNNAVLRRMVLNNNENLTQVNLANGNNVNMVNVGFQFVPNLICVQIDPGFVVPQPSGSGTHRWWYEDYSIFSEDCWQEDLAVAEQKKSFTKMSVYPNPATSTLNISGIDAKNVKVFNTLGQPMKVTSSNNSVNVESLAPGAYVLQVVDAEGNIKTTKFIKK